MMELNKKKGKSHKLKTEDFSHRLCQANLRNPLKNLSK